VEIDVLEYGDKKNGVGGVVYDNAITPPCVLSELPATYSSPYIYSVLPIVI
jgi:hypothetical protein